MHLYAGVVREVDESYYRVVWIVKGRGWIGDVRRHRNSDTRRARADLRNVEAAGMRFPKRALIRDCLPS